MTTFHYIFFAFCGLVILFLLRRHLRKSRQPNVEIAEPTAPISVPTTVEATASLSATGEADSVSWKSRRLFPEFDEPEDNSIPRIEPDEVPTVDQSDYVFGSATPALAAMMPESESRRENLKRDLKSAGYYQPHAWQNFNAIRYVFTVGTLLFFGAVLLIVPTAWELYVLALLIICPALAWAIPKLHIRNRARNRLAEIEHALPDMLDMLNMCVSQGLTVQAALQRVSGELKPVYPALAQELNILREQAELGTLEQALKNLTDRIDLADVHSFASLMIQTERMGTSVSQALAEYSDNIRESLRQQADTKANKAAFQLMFPTVLCLMPAVYVFLLGPAMIELSDFFDSGRRDLIDTGAEQIEQLEPIGQQR